MRRLAAILLVCLFVARTYGASSEAWWEADTAGWIGGLIGSFMGCLGGLVGLLAWRGHLRLTEALLTGMVVLGVIMLVAGIVAVTMRQPYAVYYSLLLGGFITSIIPVGLIPVMRGRRRQIELRRMDAEDSH